MSVNAPSKDRKEQKVVSQRNKQKIVYLRKKEKVLKKQKKVNYFIKYKNKKVEDTEFKLLRGKKN